MIDSTSRPMVAEKSRKKGFWSNLREEKSSRVRGTMQPR